MVVMNIAELKLDLFRKIDNLKESEIEKIYNKFVAILNTTSLYKLSKNENIAINDALESSNNGEVYSHEEVTEEARRKYPNLRFR
jgi:hypothetical protein